MESILVARDGPVAIVTLNRPDRGNARTPQMQTEYAQALESLANERDVRAIVVTGAGKSFSVGADFGVLQQLGDDAPHTSQPPITLPLTVPKPIIVAINGGCAGLGLVHALMCDVRFAASGAKLTTAFVRRGLIAEYGIAWLLPRLVGTAHALDLLLSGRVVLAEEAAAMGLVNRVVPPDDLQREAVAYARELATMSSPRAMAPIKRQVYGALDTSMQAALHEAGEAMLESFESPDVHEGVASFLERREPSFEPYGNG